MHDWLRKRIENQEYDSIEITFQTQKIGSPFSEFMLMNLPREDLYDLEMIVDGGTGTIIQVIDEKDALWISETIQLQEKENNEHPTNSN